MKIDTLINNKENKINNNIININQNNIENAPPKKGINIYKNKVPIISNNIESNLTYKKLLDNENRRKIDVFKHRLSQKEPNINFIQIANVNIGKSNFNKKIRRKKRSKTFKKKYSKKKYSDEFQLAISMNNKKSKNNDINNNLNDEEINNLEYDKALIIDKRTYFQYYWSLLKKKHLLLFTFYPNNDYNLKTIKICLFLLSFSLYFTINGFFFSDNTMHKIFMDNGKYNIIYLIPQIVYSSFISVVINMIVKLLSLSEKSILSIKKEDNIRLIVEFSKRIKKNLTINFILFFILNYLLLFFFWYFISCFCGAYPNTQIILIKNTLISFGLSMLYALGLYLIPGFFRIPALRAEKKDKKFIYQISLVLALF